MSKHHAQKTVERPPHRVQGMNSSQQGFHEAGEPESIRRDLVLNQDSLKLQAYHIHEEKGGTAIDNWLEAEHLLRGISGKEAIKIVNF